MNRARIVFLATAVGLQLLTAGPVWAQQTLTWKILGDTTGAPSGCSSSAAITAIDTWFAAFNRADSSALASVTRAAGARNFGVFSTGRFIPTEPFIRIDSLSDLVRYARTRARQHERMTLTAVVFSRWNIPRRALGFMPFFVRSADDLSPHPIAGIGKGEFVCQHGIRVLNLGPRNDLPGPQ